MLEYINNKPHYNGVECIIIEEYEYLIHIICEGIGYCIKKTNEWY